MRGQRDPSHDNWGSLSREAQAGLGAGAVTLLLFPSILPFPWYVSAGLSILTSMAASAVAFLVVRGRKAGRNRQS